MEQKFCMKHTRRNVRIWRTMNVHVAAPTNRQLDITTVLQTLQWRSYRRTFLLVALGMVLWRFGNNLLVKNHHSSHSWKCVKYEVTVAEISQFFVKSLQRNCFFIFNFIVICYDDSTTPVFFIIKKSSKISECLFHTSRHVMNVFVFKWQFHFARFIEV